MRILGIFNSIEMAQPEEGCCSFTKKICCWYSWGDRVRKLQPNKLIGDQGEIFLDQKRYRKQVGN